MMDHGDKDFRLWRGEVMDPVISALVFQMETRGPVSFLRITRRGEVQIERGEFPDRPDFPERPGY